jgi:hypothetical protein
VYHNFNDQEALLLDELMMQCYPDTFIGYIRKEASESKDVKQSTWLISKILEARNAPTNLE